MKFKVVTSSKTVEVVDADSEISARDPYVETYNYDTDPPTKTGAFRTTLEKNTKSKTVVTPLE